jgi:hypothetical protein
MKCLICGRLSLPGAKLCLDCKSARKRAFDATVTQPLLAAAGAARGSAATPRLLKPSQSVPDAARRAAKMAMAAQAAQIRAEHEAAPARPVSRWPWVAGAICILAVALAFLAHWYGAGKTETFTAVPSEPPTLPSIPSASSARATAADPGAAPVAATAVVPAGINALEGGSAVAVTKPDAAKRINPRAKADKTPPVLPTPEPSPPPPVVVAPPPPPPVIREAPRVDPWQPMNDAIARCPAGDISGRFSCEQRVRSQYCEGHWGQVPQCASIPYVDHGQ